MNTQAERLRDLARPTDQTPRWSGLGQPPSLQTPGSAAIRRSRARAGRMRQVGPGRLRIPSVALLSGQSSVGRTALAIGLATELASTQRVALVDLDLEQGGAPRDLGLVWEDAIGAVLRGQQPLGQALVEMPSGLQVLSGGSLCKELRGSGEISRTGRSRLVSRLNDLEACVDVMTLDLACGWQTATYELACAAQLALLVVTPAATAITAGFALFKRFVQDPTLQAQGGPEFALVVNGASRAEGERIGRGFAEIARCFLGVEIPLLGVIPDDPQVEAARAARRPFVTHAPSAPASQACARLASRVCDTLSLTRAKESL